MDAESSNSPAAVPLEATELITALNESILAGNRNDKFLWQLVDLVTLHQVAPSMAREQLLNLGLDADLAQEVASMTKFLTQPSLFPKAELRAPWDIAVARMWEGIADMVEAILSDPDMGESAANGNRFQRLCRLAVHYGLDPETFRKMLLKSGLQTSRASEIKSVLEDRDVCKRFTRKGSALTWNDALQASRDRRQADSKAPDHRLQQTCQKVVQLLVKHRAHWEVPLREDSQKPTDKLQVYREPTGNFTLTLAPSGTFKLTLAMPPVDSQP